MSSNCIEFGPWKLCLVTNELTSIVLQLELQRYQDTFFGVVCRGPTTPQNITNLALSLVKNGEKMNYADKS